MPTYEYRCQSCNCRFERRQSFNEEAISECPECQGRVHRVIPLVPVFYKGSGFYCTDNGRGYSGTARYSQEKEEGKEPAVAKEKKEEAKAEAT